MDDRIHVLHVIESLTRGGAERQLVDMVVRMDRSRFANTVCHLYERDDLREELEQAGVPVIGLHAGSRRDGPAVIQRLRALLRKGPYTVVHTWLYDDSVFGRIAAKLTGVPVVVGSMQNSWYEPEVQQISGIHPAKFAALRALDAWTGKWSRSSYVASSGFVKRSMARHLGFDERRIEVVYNAVDPQGLTPSDPLRLQTLRDELHLNGCSPILICVARLLPPKGHSYLLDALPAVVRQFPGTRLLIAGRGDEEARLREQAARLGIAENVQFLGHRPDVRDLLQVSDLFVFPSLCAEGLPVAVAEAMALERPCIGWKVEPNPEIIEHERSGLLLEPRRSDELAEAICRLAADPETRRRMGESGRRIVEERFNLDRTVRQLESHYQQRLLERPARRRAALVYRG
jgi:glycosyltransferase involved in cell wall biosynthesis